MKTRNKKRKTIKKKKVAIQDRKYTINDLDAHDREFYQEIMEEILEEHGIDPEIIFEKIKERKENKG